MLATFKNLDTGAIVVKPFDAMHVTPYMSPPDVIKKSPLANETGYITVNKETMQHTKVRRGFYIGVIGSRYTRWRCAIGSVQAFQSHVFGMW